MRVYCDPYNGLWRFDKTFERSNILFKHYPFEVSKIKKNKKKLEDKQNEIAQKLFDFCTKQDYIFIDYNIQQVYLNRESIRFNKYDIEIITSDYEEDVKKINNFLLKTWSDNKKLDKFKDDIKVKEYHPFY